MDTNDTKCQCGNKQCECSNCLCSDNKEQFEGLFSTEVAYIFGQSKNTDSHKTIELKNPRKNPQ